MENQAVCHENEHHANMPEPCPERQFQHKRTVVVVNRRFSETGTFAAALERVAMQRLNAQLD